MKKLTTAACFVAALAFGHVAWAQGTGDAPAGIAQPPGTRTDITVTRPYWSGSGPDRFFLSAVFDWTGLAARSELDLGYGKPHYRWFGLDMATALSIGGGSFSSGIRGVLPFATLRAGPRFVSRVNQRLLEPGAQITQPELDVDLGPKSRYLSLDAELSVSIPLPIGAIGALGTVYGIVDVEDDFYVFEDTLRIVMEPPIAWRARLTYLIGVGDPQTLRVGVLGEMIGNPGREVLTARVGPAVAVSLTHHLEAVAAGAFVVATPDDIGLAGGDLGQIGLRYRWATGDLWPEFP